MAAPRPIIGIRSLTKQTHLMEEALAMAIIATGNSMGVLSSERLHGRPVSGNPMTDHRRRESGSCEMSITSTICVGIKGDNRGPARMSTAAPNAERIAQRLNMEPWQLRQFVEFHPDPAVDDVVRLTERPADEIGADDREDIARWIDDIREKPAPEDLPGATPRLDGQEFGRDQDLWWDPTDRGSDGEAADE